MPKFTLSKDSKTKDYRFIDKIVSQQMYISGTLIHVHKYLGPINKMLAPGETADPTQPVITESNELTIQDLLLLENRDRNYDADIIELRGNYTVNDIELNLSQFGIFLAGDSLMVSFHLNDMVERLGRKLMAGDVLELIHKRDDLVLGEDSPAINAFYVVRDATRSAEGYSPTWFSHIWRVRAEPLKDSQEYSQILDKIQTNGKTLEEVISTYTQMMDINEAVVDMANQQVPDRNFQSSHLYVNQAGTPIKPSNLLPWTFNGDGVPPNENNLPPHGTRFPQTPLEGEYFLRTDYKPVPRLFRREHNKWKAVEDVWRREYSVAHRVLTEVLDPTETTTVGPYPEDTFQTRQGLPDVVKPKAKIPEDNGDILKGLDKDLDDQNNC